MSGALIFSANVQLLTPKSLPTLLQIFCNSHLICITCCTLLEFTWPSRNFDKKRRNPLQCLPSHRPATTEKQANNGLVTEDTNTRWSQVRCRGSSPLHPVPKLVFLNSRLCVYRAPGHDICDQNTAKPLV